VWYGPHQCNGCGETVVVLSRQQGGLALNAPHNHNYPNHVWEEHVCDENKGIKSIFEVNVCGGTNSSFAGMKICTCGTSAANFIGT